MVIDGYKMRNILFIAHVTSLYGANRSMLDILRYIDREKFNVYVILPSKGEVEKELRSLKVMYKVVNMCWTTHATNESFQRDKIYINIHAVKKICEYIHKWNIDIVHTNSSVINLGAIAARITHSRHIWHMRELPNQYDFTSDSKYLDKYLLRKSDRVICISKYVEKELFGKKKMKNTVRLYNAIDINKYSIEREEILQKDIVNIFVCGAIIEVKKQLIVVQAVKLLVDKGYHNIRLTIVGDGYEYREKIINYIKKNELNEYVRLEPFVADLSQYRKNADIAVMSSINEALGRVTIESMLSELVLIGADSGATSELIKDYYNGLKYQSESPKELAERIEYVLFHKDKIKKMIKNAKKFALKNFEASNRVKQLEQIYCDVTH